MYDVCFCIYHIFALLLNPECLNCMAWFARQVKNTGKIQTTCLSDRTFFWNSYQCSSHQFVNHDLPIIDCNKSCEYVFHNIFHSCLKQLQSPRASSLTENRIHTGAAGLFSETDFNQPRPQSLPTIQTAHSPTESLDSYAPHEQFTSISAPASVNSMTSSGREDVQCQVDEDQHFLNGNDFTNR